MSRAIFLVFLTASVLVVSVHPSREPTNESERYPHPPEGVSVSVSPRSFHMALTQVHDEQNVQPEDKAAELAQPLERPAGESQSASGIKSGSQDEAKAKLEEVALETQRVVADSDRLDAEMHAQYTALLGDEVPQAGTPNALVSVGETQSPPSEDEQFAALESQTENIMQWFQQLKKLRHERDSLKAKKDAAVKGASSAGMRPEDIAKKLLTNSPPETPKSKPEADPKPMGGSLMEKREELASVMASSAIEMAQLQHAAANVVTSLDAYKTWKNRINDSAESAAEAVSVKAKLDAAMKFLKEHENTIDNRRNQINAMMREANMGQL